MSGSLELIVGQDIKIRAKIKPTDIGGAGVQSSEWSVPGTVAQEWEADNDSAELDELEADERKQPGNGTDPGPEHPVQFYWYKGTDAGQDHEVKCEFTLDKGGPLKGVVKYEVVKPEDNTGAENVFTRDAWSFETEETGPNSVIKYFIYGTKPLLKGAGAPQTSYGIYVSANFSIPSGFSGNYQSVQTIEKTRKANGVAYDQGAGLDKRYPAYTGPVFADAPGLGIVMADGTIPASKSLDLSAVTTFLFRPDIENSHWVPVGKFNWSVSYEYQNMDSDNFSFDKVRESVVGAGSVVPLQEAAYPEWSSLAP